MPSFNVRDFGAKGDGAAKDTAAIQKALDAAHQQGGGTVVVPAGRYLSGRIHLKSNVTLYLSPGSVLLASTDNANFDPYETFPFHSVSYREATYFHYALVAAEGVHDIAIKLCERVTIRGITVRNSPDYSIRFWGTERGYIDPRYFQPNEVRFGSRVYNPSQKTSGALDRRWYHKG